MKTKTEKKRGRGRPYGSFSLKVLPDGSKKRISIFEYRKELSKAKAESKLKRLGNSSKTQKPKERKQIVVIFNF